MNPSAANYQLVSTSLLKSAAGDGTDIGVNFTTLNAALSGASTRHAAPIHRRRHERFHALLRHAGRAAGHGAVRELRRRRRRTSPTSTRRPATAGGAYRSNAVDIKAATDTGGGYLVGWTKAGEWLNYTVAVAKSATYTLDVRLASDGVGGTFHIEVNGVNKTGAIQVPDTGGWQNWRTVTKSSVTLAAGTQTVKFVLDTIGPSGSVANFNWFAVH